MSALTSNYDNDVLLQLADHWLASRAEQRNAHLIPRLVALGLTDLYRVKERVVGVDAPKDEQLCLVGAAAVLIPGGVHARGRFPPVVV